MYEELVAKIIEKSGMQAEEHYVQKGGVKKISISVGNGDIRPAIYPECFPDDMSIDEMADKIIEIAKEHSNDVDGNIAESLTSWDFCKDRLYACLRTKTNDDKIIRQEFLDLEKYLRVRIDEEKSAVVSKSLCDTWGKTEEEVFAAATVEDSEVTSMGAMLSELSEITGMPIEKFEPEDDNNLMLIVTNARRFNGSSALVNTEFWEKFREKIKQDFYILPSSIHELIVIPAKDAVLDELKNMVCEVNDTQVKPEERLSYSVYEYKNGKICIAA